MIPSLFILALLSFSLLHKRFAVAEGPTECADSEMDWYMGAVGETPCTTYQRLRQICDPTYRVETLNTSLPPETCDGQECCCNSISFGLSMLCITCQQGFSKFSNGFDAPPGTYQQYLIDSSNKTCSPRTDRSFTVDVQNSVCSQAIKIFDAMYSRIWWDDGSWFYRWTHDFLTENIATTSGNTFTHCNSTILSTSSSTSVWFLPSSTSSTTDSGSSANASPSTNIEQNSSPGEMTSSSSSGLSGGAIGGIVIGAIVVLALWVFLLWVWKVKGTGRHSLSKRVPQGPTLTPFISESMMGQNSSLQSRWER